jgi:hypothetical protein
MGGADQNGGGNPAIQRELYCKVERVLLMWLKGETRSVLRPVMGEAPEALHRGDRAVGVVVSGLNRILAARTVAMARKIGGYSHKHLLLNGLRGCPCINAIESKKAG